MTPKKSNRPTQKKRGKSHERLWWFLLAFVLLPLTLWGALFLNNNLSLTSDRAFADRLDQAIEKATRWVNENNHAIQERKNFAIARMLQDIDTLTAEPVYLETIKHFLDMPIGTFDCWKRLLDPQRPVSSFNLNKVIQQDYLDNKWILYAIAPEQAHLTQETRKGLFDPRRWTHRVLTHQLWALIHLRQRSGHSQEWDSLIQQIGQRLSRREKIAICVYDIYIQRIGFILFAGHPELINRRWIERIMDNQKTDGGWNDRWFCLQSDSRRPTLDVDQASTQHTTIQALWTLMQIKYRYPQHFGLQ